MLIPSLLAFSLASGMSGPSVWILALIIFGLNAWCAYSASVHAPRNIKIHITNQTLQLSRNHGFQAATIEEQLWFGAHWGLIRLLMEQQTSLLIFLSPITVNNREELRRFKVQATYNKQLSQVTVDNLV